MGWLKSMGKSISRQLGKAGIGRSDGERARGKAEAARKSNQYMDNQDDVTTINGKKYYKNVEIKGGSLGEGEGAKTYTKNADGTYDQSIAAGAVTHSGLDEAMETWQTQETARKGARQILAANTTRGKNTVAAGKKASSTAGAVSNMLTRAKSQGASTLITDNQKKKKPGIQ